MDISKEVKQDDDNTIPKKIIASIYKIVGWLINKWQGYN